MKGYLQIYTGDGKGKTTAALGLLLRACGAGLNVYLGQFLKKEASETLCLKKRFPDVTLAQFGPFHFIRGTPTPEERTQAREGLQKLEAAMLSGKYNLVIADEINNAVAIGLLTVDEVLQCLTRRPEQVELVLTGRNADPAILEQADLVTEMKAVRHYFTQGVQARTGIEW